jgi:hypothetical protein
VCTVLPLRGTATIEPGTVDLVVWPENVIDVDHLRRQSPSSALVAAEARSHRRTLRGRHHGGHSPTARASSTRRSSSPLNGEVLSRYEKVRRVPFGEYMPMRGLLHPRSARPPTWCRATRWPAPGRRCWSCPTAPAWPPSSRGKFSSVDRVNEGIEAGGSLIINPTNGSSYTLDRACRASRSRRRVCVPIEQQQVGGAGLAHRASARSSPQTARCTSAPSVSEQAVLIRTIDLRTACAPGTRRPATHPGSS